VSGGGVYCKSEDAGIYLWQGGRTNSGLPVGGRQVVQAVNAPDPHVAGASGGGEWLAGEGVRPSGRIVMRAGWVVCGRGSVWKREDGCWFACRPTGDWRNGWWSS
jgi:hypothetical protein